MTTNVSATPAAATPSAAPSTPSAPASKPASTNVSSPVSSPTPPKRLTNKEFRQQIKGVDSDPDGGSPWGAIAQNESIDPSDTGTPDFFPAETSEGGTEIPEPSEPVQEEAPEADYSWLDSFKPYQKIHDVESLEILKALQEGRLPEQLYSKLRLQLKDGNDSWEDSIEGLRNSAMMRSKFSKKTAELAQERKAWEAQKQTHDAEIRGISEYMNGWRSDNTGASLLAGLERMGMPVEAAARALAGRLQRIDQLTALEQAGHVPPGTVEEFKAVQAHKLQVEQERGERIRAQQLAQQLQQQQQQVQQQEQIQHTKTWFDNTSTKAFEQAGLPMSQGTWNLFVQEFQALTAGETEMTEGAVREAVLAAKERYESWAGQHQAAQAKQAPPMTAARVDSGSVKRAPQANFNTGKQKTNSQFLKDLKRNQRGY